MLSKAKRKIDQDLDDAAHVRVKTASLLAKALNIKADASEQIHKALKYEFLADNEPLDYLSGTYSQSVSPLVSGVPSKKKPVQHLFFNCIYRLQNSELQCLDSANLKWTPVPSNIT